MGPGAAGSRDCLRFAPLRMVRYRAIGETETSDRVGWFPVGLLSDGRCSEADISGSHLTFAPAVVLPPMRFMIDANVFNFAP